MGSLFGDDEPPPPPQEDPAVTQQRRLAEARAEQERVRSQQDELRVQTETRQASEFGSRSLLGSLGTLTTRLGAG